MSESYPGNTPGSYVVGTGDTLQSIALAVFGDAKLWYLVADANGLQGDGDLKVGQTLNMPNQITNIHNSFDTFKPYNAGEIIGDTTPTLPDPPPPPAADGGGCDIGNIIVAIIAVVVTVYSAGAFATAGSFLSAGFGATMSAGVGAGLGASAFGAVVGSIVSQAIGVATGVQDKFSWVAVAMAGLASAAIPTGGLTKGLTGTGKIVANAAARNIVSQGVGVAVGVQDKFSWRSLAAAAIAAPVASKISGSVLGEGKLFGTSQFASELVSGFVHSSVTQGTRILLGGQGKMQWSQIAGDAFGNAIGNAIVREMAGASSVMGPNDGPQISPELLEQRRAVAADQIALRRQGAAAGVAYKAAPTTSGELGARKDLERVIAQDSRRSGGREWAYGAISYPAGPYEKIVGRPMGAGPKVSAPASPSIEEKNILQRYYEWLGEASEDRRTESNRYYDFQMDKAFQDRSLLRYEAAAIGKSINNGYYHAMSFTANLVGNSKKADEQWSQFKGYSLDAGEGTNAVELEVPFAGNLFGTQFAGAISIGADNEGRTDYALSVNYQPNINGLGSAGFSSGITWAKAWNVTGVTPLLHGYSEAINTNIDASLIGSSGEVFYGEGLLYNNSAKLQPVARFAQMGVGFSVGPKAKVFDLKVGGSLDIERAISLGATLNGPNSKGFESSYFGKGLYSIINIAYGNSLDDIVSEKTIK